MMNRTRNIVACFYHMSPLHGLGVHS